ncbi:hypothetical protein AVEN_200245-1 [Araneus ventricosus]|uniref:Uncharacterized protein n=1 Tax=Araneus ventricosus TaxID=182803 RepID=A0A4Y2DSQ7_ARAVE|nr:hypothetical protein AVEN_200245-1 [Araneus ventricosus]
MMSEPRWPGGKASAFEPECSNFETRFCQRSALYMGLVLAKSDVKGHKSSRWCGVEIWRGYRPRYLIAFKLTRSMPKRALELFQNATLISETCVQQYSR